MNQRTFFKSALLSLSALALTAVATVSVQKIHAADGDLKIYKFEADWCAPCQKMKPIFKKVSGDFKDVKFQTVNVDKDSRTADRFKVSILPTVIAVKNDEIVGRTTGFKSAYQLKSFIKKHNR
jgi:thiol-disulfide isomerase/thioredoxin